VEGLKGLWETLKQFKHQSPQPKFCPKCKGSNIYPASSLGGLLPTVYKCNNCGYEGHLVFELDPEEGSESEET
jgi:predicted RNA-binding Zn-ribbon protein involved in translation (DUF1610 family)